MTERWPAAVAETHVSVVVFVDDRALKLYKPLRLPFVDQSTPERRLALARREVDLNRRLAPDVYLGILDVERDGEVVDHLIEMVRMPADRRLSTLVAETAAEDEVRAVARAVAVFHEAAETSSEIAAAGSPDAVSRLWEDSFEELEERRDELLAPDVLDRVTLLARRYLSGRRELLEARVAAGWTRDGHGDLLTDDIFCLADGPRILDCLAFDDRLRQGDVLLDVAFLAMDLERLDRADLARVLLDAYDELTGERHPMSLAHHYVAYRALVRCKVACLRATQDPAGSKSIAEAGALLALCRDHLEAARIRLVLVGGGPGVGKSTLASELSNRTGWALLSSDELRKDLAGRAHGERRSEGLDQGMYSDAATDSMYAELLRRAGDLLALGESVVLDASWASAAHRARAAAVAEGHVADVVAVECHAPPDVCHDRLVRRAEAGTDPSDATAALAPALAGRRDPWPGAMPVATGGELEEAVEAARVAADGPA